MVGRIYLNQYETVRLIGKGGMGSAYLARDRNEDGPVVVKVMHEHLAATPRFREAFQRETELMARLNHPNAVRLLAASADDPKAPFLVMEYVQGVTMQKLLEEHKSFTPARVRRLVAQLCQVVQAAHDQGIIHRDLKPANILVVDPDTPYETLKVLDFGLAEMQQPGAGTGRSASGARPAYGVGTAGYMSPEQVRGELVDGRADVYSIGVILYQLLTGQMPFPGNNHMEIFLAQATETPRSFAELGMAGRVSPHVEALIFACLAVELDDRPESAMELFELYEAALREGAAPSEPEAEETPEAEGDGPDPYVYVDKFDIWVPEQMAKYKLKGFIEAVGGKVTANQPGLLRVRIPQSNGALSGLFSLFGSTRAALCAPIELELQMQSEPTKSAKGSCLHVVASIRLAGKRKLPQHRLWDERRDAVCHTLRSYLVTKE
jgi:serine/threonine-protein kinase